MIADALPDARGVGATARFWPSNEQTGSQESAGLTATRSRSRLLGSPVNPLAARPDFRSVTGKPESTQTESHWSRRARSVVDVIRQLHHLCWAHPAEPFMR